MRRYYFYVKNWKKIKKLLSITFDWTIKLNWTWAHFIGTEKYPSANFRNWKHGPVLDQSWQPKVGQCYWTNISVQIGQVLSQYWHGRLEIEISHASAEAWPAMALYWAESRHYAGKLCCKSKNQCPEQQWHFTGYKVGITLANHAGSQKLRVWPGNGTSLGWKSKLLRHTVL